MVSPVSEESIQDHGAYILFYRRRIDAKSASGWIQSGEHAQQFALLAVHFCVLFSVGGLGVIGHRVVGSKRLEWFGGCVFLGGCNLPTGRSLLPKRPTTKQGFAMG